MDNQAAYEFINSKDIREHLRKLDYPLTPVQCAFLVWQSRRHTLKEKHEAWEDIIATMPDCPVERRLNCRGWYSLHEMLRGYIAFEQKCLSLFEQEGSNVFYDYEYFHQSLRMAYSDDIKYEWWEGRKHFRSLKSCFSEAAEEAKEEHCRFKITKHYMDAFTSEYTYEPTITVEYDEGENILEVYMNGTSEFFSLTEEEEDLWSTSFDGMWFDIPIPFEKGDIVCDNASIYTKGIPFVLMGTTPWFLKEHARKEKVNTYSDYSDMAAYGYSADKEHLFLYDDFRVDYLNLEYYTEPLKDFERLLTAYSEFEKGQNDGYTLLQMYRMIWAESIAETDRKMLSYLPKETFSKYRNTTIGETNNDHKE